MNADDELGICLSKNEKYIKCRSFRSGKSVIGLAVGFVFVGLNENSDC